jgi:hypothetical protein
MARRLEHFYPEKQGHGAETAYKAGRFLARWFTVYNPANTALNVGSDFGVGLMGLPGEKADPAGFLRFYPQAFVESVRGAFGRAAPVYERAIQEGLGSATYVESVAGGTVPEHLAEAAGIEVKKGVGSRLANVARRVTPVPVLMISPRLARTVATGWSSFSVPIESSGTIVAVTVSDCSCSADRP